MAALVSEPSVSNGLITLAWSRTAGLKRVVMTAPPSIVATSANNHSLALARLAAVLLSVFPRN